MHTLASAEQEGIKWAASKNKSSITDLRKMSAENLSRNGMNMGMYGPIADGYVLPAPIPDIYAQAKQNHTPFLTGWNADEGIVVIYKTRETFLKEAQQFGKDSATFLHYYPASTDQESAASQMALSRDKMMGLAGYKWAEIESSTSRFGTYMYYFTHKPPTAGNNPKYGAYHSAEIGYALNNLKIINRPWEPVDDSLETIISSYWINFAKTGDPNGKGLPLWPRYDNRKNMVMIFSEQPRAEKLPNKEALDFLYSKIR